MRAIPYLLVVVLDVLQTLQYVNAFHLRPTQTKRVVDTPSSSFVTTQNGDFMLDGKPFFHFATNAYWLSDLSDQDLTTTLQAIAQTNITVVRTWAFHDVITVPSDDSTYFQLLQDGTATINTGPTGLQRLDKILQVAESFGLHVMFTLTNNWNPVKSQSTTVDFPSGFLSNDYGGIDAYVRNFVGPDGFHDGFFTNQSLIAAFQNYLDVVVARYANSTTLFAWEIANDPRCNGTQPTSPTCATTDLTSWVQTISRHIKQLDPNHLVAAGSGGFICMACPKIIQTAPPVQASPAPGSRRRAVSPLSPAKILAKRTELLTKWKNARGASSSSRKRIRGKWSAPATKRQILSLLGPAFNGESGVDSEDINNIQDVDFATFQFFPDQNNYMSVESPDVDPITQAIDTGTAWIQMNAQVAASAQKPSALTAFGVVAQSNAPNFVPFNLSSTTVADVLNNAVKVIGFNATTQATAYNTWIQSSIDSGVSSISQYQWGQSFSSSTSPIVTTSPLTAVSSTSLLTPDDGYASYSNQEKSIFQQGAVQQTAKNSP